MNFKTFDRTSIKVDGKTYKHTIDAYEFNYGFVLGITDVSSMLNKSIREALHICEEYGVYVANTGKLFFESKEMSDDFIKMLKERLE